MHASGPRRSAHSGTRILSIDVVSCTQYTRMSCQISRLRPPATWRHTDPLPPASRNGPGSACPCKRPRSKESGVGEARCSDSVPSGQFPCLDFTPSLRHRRGKARSVPRAKAADAHPKCPCRLRPSCDPLVRVASLCEGGPAPWPSVFALQRSRLSPGCALATA